MKVPNTHLHPWLICILLPVSLGAQTGRVGINTLSPAATLHVADSNVVFSGGTTLPGTPGAVPVTGQGVRMIWYADKAALRTGYDAGSAWDKDSIGNYSLACGFNTKGIGTYAVAMGQQTVASGLGSFAWGRFTRASGFGAMAGGRDTRATALQSAAFGRLTIASGTNATAFGQETTASGPNSVAMGFQTQALLDNAIAAGSMTMVGGMNGMAIGDQTFAGNNALATGYLTNASANSFTAGTSTQASGLNSIATGNLSIASGNSSFATGDGTNATGDYAFSSGWLNSANGNQSFVTGQQNIALGNHSLAAGYFNEANGTGAVAMGKENIVSGDYALSMGDNLIANSYACLVLGRLNDTTGVNSSSAWSTNDPVLVVGDGFVDQNNLDQRSNSMVLTKNGDLVLNPNGPPEARLDVNGTVKIGFNGTPLNSVNYEVKMADLPPIAAGASYNHIFTVISAGLAVSVSPEFDLPDGLIIAYSRSLSSVVVTRFINVSGGSIDVPAMNYYIMSVQ